MKTKLARTALTVSALALLLGLGGCGDRVENTEMPQAQAPNVEINRAGMEGADANAQVKVEKDNTVRMGTGDTSVMDPDVLIAEQVRAAFANNPDFGAMKIDVHSDEGVVTLRGRAPDPSARDRASDIARSVREVKGVENQLTLG